ncbi:GTP cyclohydrolase 1 type 2/Nif3 [Apiosordaria backusii]|uniref:ATP phosphoribosyltransferase n=1 Tax=Apiosordaria backusii TaxID=314023 RepID=A0AA40EMH6_9PEZI|nr:GTP cyclohydrolase 1 type 2/Nif3 [Apiosordaria backusii]
MGLAIKPAAARFKLIFYVPPTHLQICKDAIFAAGAGRYPGPGNYTECCWTTLGIGQFNPGEGANPHTGEIGALTQKEEARVETLCVSEDVVRSAVTALKSVHPYEEPAYEVFKMENF